MFSAQKNAAPADGRLYVEDVFSTWLYTGTGSAQTITNGIDLAGKGGLVWTKSRSNAFNHTLADTVRGGNNVLYSNTSVGNQSYPSTIYNAFTSAGYTLGNANEVNGSSYTYASWTFREAPKFFDVVTYTGTGANRTIAHNLGVAPGCILVKRTNTSGDWQVYHRSNANTEYMVLNSTASVATGTTRWNSTTPTATEFTVGTDATVNASGGTYVAYLFAHDTASTGIIQCGSFTIDGSYNATVNLGWEPQWVLTKKSNAGGNWRISDNMRGMPNTQSQTAILNPDFNNVEGVGGTPYPTATGFYMDATGPTNPGETFIYIAIRRGPMKTPTLGTSVLSVKNYAATTSSASVTHDVTFDLEVNANRSVTVAKSLFVDSLRGINGVVLQTASTNPENSYPAYWSRKDQRTMYAPSAWDGYWASSSGTNNHVSYAFVRAPGFFDAVCYTGNGGTAGYKNLFFDATNNNKNPYELVIMKCRGTTSDWFVGYSFSASACKGMFLNKTDAETQYISSTTPVWRDASNYLNLVNRSAPLDFNAAGTTYVAYLFASCPGVSKFGTYTGNGSSQTINCGFAAGARFVMIKRTNSTGDWYVWDTARGIVAGNDPHLSLNTTAAEVTTDDTIDTDNSGFVVNQVSATDVNVSSATYIYLAIA